MRQLVAHPIYIIARLSDDKATETEAGTQASLAGRDNMLGKCTLKYSLVRVYELYS
jgi:hypothetical protein